MNPRCAPERIRAAHPAQEGPDLRVEPWPARAAASALPVPVVPEPLSVPGKHCSGWKLLLVEGNPSGRLRSVPAAGWRTRWSPGNQASLVATPEGGDAHSLKA